MSINFKEIQSDLVSSLTSYIDSRSSKHDIYKSNLSKWKKIVLTLVDDKFWNCLECKDIKLFPY